MRSSILVAFLNTKNLGFRELEWRTTAPLAQSTTVFPTFFRMLGLKMISLIWSSIINFYVMHKTAAF